MSVLFINGSPSKDGNTVGLAKVLLKETEFETLNLTDYRINIYGQDLPGDQFEEVLQKIEAADIVVIGSPVYWHNICGSVRTLLDRFYGLVKEGSLHGKLFFIYQGAAPEKWMLEKLASTLLKDLQTFMDFIMREWRQTIRKRKSFRIR